MNFSLICKALWAGSEFQCWKNSFFFDWSNNTGTIDMKMDESALEEKSSFKMLGLTFSSKLD